MAKPISASLVLCESVLIEKTGIVSAIRILTSVNIPLSVNSIRFYALTFLTSPPHDTELHVLRTLMIEERADGWNAIATAPDQTFHYGYAVDQHGPGGFYLSTEFTIDVTKLATSGIFFVQAWLDGERVAQTPITLRPERD
jgi:hypothetical protein